MAREIHKEVGHGFDGSYRFTLTVIVAFLMVAVGVGAVAYAGIYIVGVPLILFGLMLPIILEMILAQHNT